MIASLSRYAPASRLLANQSPAAVVHLRRGATPTIAKKIYRRGGNGELESFVRMSDGSLRRFDESTGIVADEHVAESTPRVAKPSRAARRPAGDDPAPIAAALLSAAPDAIVAIIVDRKGVVVGTTITRAAKRITAATVRAALRSVVAMGGRHCFIATTGELAVPVRLAANTAGEILLVKIADFITPS